MVIWAGAFFGLRVLLVSPEPPPADAFVRAHGQELYRAGQPFRLKSVGFANDYNFDLGEYGFSLSRSQHHEEKDFERVRALGFNSIRFAFNGNWYRDNPRAFWRWLDRNVGWAEKHGLLLTLDLHVPIGGFWLDSSAGEGDFRIWTDERIRAENIELWRRIAERYAEVPAIAAYDILNEAVTADETGDQWRRLAEDMARAIRDVDDNHLLIVGALYGTERRYASLSADAQFLIDDDNVMYDFHFYEPVAFTHQTAHWLAKPIADGGVYPDKSAVIPTGEQVLLPRARINSRRLPAGDSDWLKYESDWAPVSDPRAVAGLPTVTFRSNAAGSVFFDDLEVFERDPETGTVTRVLHAPLTGDDVQDWWAWGSEGQPVPAEVFSRALTTGVNDTASLKIDGRVGSGGVLGWSNDAHFFDVTPGMLYRISGYMTGAGVDYSDRTGFIGLALDVYAHPKGQQAGGFLPRGRDDLERRFRALHAFGVANNVPMSVMEFGTIRKTFDALEKGGALWIADMLDIFAKYGVSYSLWNYHGASMGIYQSSQGSLPAVPNAPLIEVLQSRQ